MYSSGQNSQSFNPENYPKKKKYNTNDTSSIHDGHRGSQAGHRGGRRGQELSFSENPDSQEKKFKERKPTLVTETNSTEANIQKKFLLSTFNENQELQNLASFQDRVGTDGLPQADFGKNYSEESKCDDQLIKTTNSFNHGAPMENGYFINNDESENSGAKNDYASPDFQKGGPCGRDPDYNTIYGDPGPKSSGTNYQLVSDKYRDTNGSGSGEKRGQRNFKKKKFAGQNQTESGTQIFIIQPPIKGYQGVKTSTDEWNHKFTGIISKIGQMKNEIDFISNENDQMFHMYSENFN